jgi:hypothetical protein
MIANFSLHVAYNKIAKTIFVITLAQLTNKESRFNFLKVTKRIRKLNEILKENLKK